MQQGSSGMGTALLGVANIMVMLILLPIYTFLILYYRKLIHKFLVDVFPDRHRSRVEDVLKESKPSCRVIWSGCCWKWRL